MPTTYVEQVVAKLGDHINRITIREMILILKAHERDGFPKPTPDIVKQVSTIFQKIANQETERFEKYGNEDGNYPPRLYKVWNDTNLTEFLLPSWEA